MTRLGKELRLASEGGGKDESIFTTILDCISQAVAVFDRNLRLTYFNRRYVEFFDFPHDVAKIGARLEDIIRYNILHGGLPVEDPEAYIAARIESARSSSRQELAHHRADGTIILIRRTPLPDGGFLNIYTDGTERAQIAREAERNAELLRMILEHMADGIRVFDKNLRLIAWNSQSFEMLGYPPHLARVGTPFEAFLDYHAERGDSRADDPGEGKQARIERASRAFGRGSEVVSPDGRTIQKRRNPMPGGGFVSTYQDVTPLKHAQALLREAKERAELANRVKSEFLANVSHELRTPLNAIIGFSQIMSDQLRGPLNNPDYLEYARLIRESGMHLLAIINDILDLSKVEAGKTKLNEESINIADVLRSCLRMIEEKAARENLTLSLQCAEHLPSLTADVRLLKQIVLNLLSNALKFTPAGGTITVTAAVDDGLKITVADTGIGMDEADIPRAFSPFTQLENTLVRRFEGTGLGLPLADSFVRLHGGTLTLHSKPNCGTTAIIRLPPHRLDGSESS